MVDNQYLIRERSKEVEKCPLTPIDEALESYLKESVVSEISVQVFLDLKISDRSVIFAWHRGYRVCSDGSIKTSKIENKADCLPWRDTLSIKDHNQISRKIRTARLYLFCKQGLTGLLNADARHRGLVIFDTDQNRMRIHPSLIMPEIINQKLPPGFFLSHSRLRDEFKSGERKIPSKYDPNSKRAVLLPPKGRPLWADLVMSPYDSQIVNSYKQGWRVQLKKRRLYNVNTLKEKELKPDFRLAPTTSLGNQFAYPLKTIDMYLFGKHGYDYFRPGQALRYKDFTAHLHESIDLVPEYLCLRDLELVDISSAEFNEYKALT